MLDAGHQVDALRTSGYSLFVGTIFRLNQKINHRLMKIQSISLLMMLMENSKQLYNVENKINRYGYI